MMMITAAAITAADITAAATAMRMAGPRTIWPPTSASAPGVGRTSFTVTFGGNGFRGGRSPGREGAGAGWLAAGPPAQAPDQCVETRARRDWRKEPIVAITALGS
jgi:hypothetical protein